MLLYILFHIIPWLCLVEGSSLKFSETGNASGPRAFKFLSRDKMHFFVLLTSTEGEKKRAAGEGATTWSRYSSLFYGCSTTFTDGM